MINTMFKDISNLIKNIGAVPRNKPIVVIPNASPGALFSLDTNIPRVIAIVIEKNITPISDTIIILSPKHKNGIAINVENIATFLIPNKSDNIPPSALPNPIVQKNITFWSTVLFQDVGIPYPIYPLIITTNKAIIITTPEFILGFTKSKSFVLDLSIKCLLPINTIGNIDIIGNISNIGFIEDLASNLPVITPNEPPDTNIAAGDNLPLEAFKVVSAPDTCKNALPKHNNTNEKMTSNLVKPNIIYDIINNKTPINPILILGYLSDI